MSNALSVAVTTAALAYRLTQAMSDYGFVGGATPGRPNASDAADPDPAIKVFLYRVEPDAARRNEDLPTRSGTAVVSRPRVALTLQYLLVFLGDESVVVPDRLLGVAATTLHAQPLLSTQEIESGWTAAIAGGAIQDLATAPDRVRLTITALSLEELTNVWSSLLNQPYRLSLAVTAEALILEPDVPAVRPSPVTIRRLIASPVRAPEIVSVVVDGSSAAAPAPIVAGARLHLAGRDLLGEDATIVWFGDVSAVPEGPASVPKAEAPTDADLIVTLPLGTAPGVLGVAIEHRRFLGNPPALRTARRSALFPIVVTPVVTAAITAGVTASATVPPTYSGDVEVTLRQAVADTQPVILHLNGGGEALVFEQRSRTSAGGATADLTLPFTGVPAGSHLVRVTVSGATSIPDVTTAGPDAGTIAGPSVSLP